MVDVGLAAEEVVLVDVVLETVMAVEIGLAFVVVVVLVVVIEKVSVVVIFLV